LSVVRCGNVPGNNHHQRRRAPVSVADQPIGGVRRRSAGVSDRLRPHMREVGGSSPSSPTARKIRPHDRLSGAVVHLVLFRARRWSLHTGACCPREARTQIYPNPTRGTRRESRGAEPDHDAVRANHDLAGRNRDAARPTPQRWRPNHEAGGRNSDAGRLNPSPSALTRDTGVVGRPPARRREALARRITSLARRVWSLIRATRTRRRESRLWGLEPSPR
jgi:hypothetical protein